MSYSPELSPIDYSEDEKEPVAPPTIKLKLKLNPYPPPPEDKKKKKHKKKHKKHKKSKRSDREEDDQPADEDVVYHRPQLGGKRPFAMLQQQHQQQQQQQQPQEEESDNESYHPTDTKKTKYEPTSYDYDQQPLEHTTPQRTSTKQERRTSSMKSTSTLGEKPKKRGRPTNKAKAAAIIAQLPPKVPETPKKDMKSIFLKLLDTVQK